MPKEVVEGNKTHEKIGAILISYKVRAREIKILEEDNQLREVNRS